jgi:hypothetical protein
MTYWGQEEEKLSPTIFSLYLYSATERNLSKKVVSKNCALHVLICVSTEKHFVANVWNLCEWCFVKSAWVAYTGKRLRQIVVADALVAWCWVGLVECRSGIGLWRELILLQLGLDQWLTNEGLLGASRNFCMGNSYKNLGLVLLNSTVWRGLAQVDTWLFSCRVNRP